ncbi:MAG: UbiH/UbiF family hydroxylase [Rhizobiaceae bacterium]|nr:UbiH/UbiF family hydroxylase [Rhizobiaceae bacterium]
MSGTASTQVLVAGAGPVGMIAALALARAGFSTVLAGPPASEADRRTTAVMAPSLAFLAILGLQDSAFEGAAPLKTMRIIDATSRLVRSPTVTFHAAEIGESRFGLNIPNRLLNAVLERAVAAEAGITRVEKPVNDWNLGDLAAEAVFADGEMIASQLVVAADGRNSPARDAAGIRARRHELPQAALVVSFSHARPHGGSSTEFHTEDGPFTQVPLPGDRSSLVWVTKPANAQELLALDGETLALRIEERMQSMLGKISVEDGRQVYPLAEISASPVARSRVALVGEAAHVFPPIGAQGLNLGIRDVEDVVAAVTAHRDDPGSSAALNAYARRRLGDVTARSGLVNLLNRSLLSSFLPAQIARTAGLTAMREIGPLRTFAMREGLRPGSGFYSLFPRSREQVDR